MLKNKIGEGTYGYIFPLTYTYNKKEHGAVIKIGKIKQERYVNVNKDLKQIYEFKRCREKECHAHFLIPSLPGIGLYHSNSATTAPNTPGPTKPPGQPKPTKTKSQNENMVFVLGVITGHHEVVLIRAGFVRQVFSELCKPTRILKSLSSHSIFRYHFVSELFDTHTHTHTHNKKT